MMRALFLAVLLMASAAYGRGVAAPPGDYSHMSDIISNAPDLALKFYHESEVIIKAQARPIDNHLQIADYSNELYCLDKTTSTMTHVSNLLSDVLPDSLFAQYELGGKDRIRTDLQRIHAGLIAVKNVAILVRTTCGTHPKLIEQSEEMLRFYSKSERKLIDFSKSTGLSY